MLHSCKMEVEKENTGFSNLEVTVALPGLLFAG